MDSPKYMKMKHLKQLYCKMRRVKAGKRNFIT